MFSEKTTPPCGEQGPLRQRETVAIGPLKIGGNHPVVVQSMTNTDTSEAQKTAEQVYALYQAGSEVVRVTVNHEAAARAIPEIYNRLVAMGWEEPVLVGDFHYNGHRLLKEFPEAAKHLAKYRINPGNVGFGDKHDANFATMIQVALEHDKPVRIGVNWGSLDASLVSRMMDHNATSKNPQPAHVVYEQAMVASALESASMAQRLGMPKNKIILACKVSDVNTLVRLYQNLARQDTYALHLGLTEAGMGSKGIVATASALSLLLSQGIGDTIRASLTPDPGGDRTTEVRVCQEILQTLGLRSFSPLVTACPGCGRTTSTVYQELAMSIQTYLREQMPLWRKKYPGVADLKVAVMGCVVNGPGESKHADIGISLPGTGETPAAPVFIDGEKAMTLRGHDLAGQFTRIVAAYVAQRYGQP